MGVGVEGQVHHFRPLGVWRLGVPSIVGVEGSHSGRRGYRVVVSMLCHQEKVYLVVLLLIEKREDECYDNLFDSFSQSIGLGAKGRGYTRVDSYDCEEIYPGVGWEPEVSVRHDVMG